MTDDLGGSRMILPEDRRYLQNATLENKRKNRPVLSDQKLDELNQQLADAIKSESVIKLTVFHPLENQVFMLNPKYVDVLTHRLYSDDLEGDRVIIKLIDILDIEFINKS